MNEPLPRRQHAPGCTFRPDLIELPCGCQDAKCPCGFLYREHDHVSCDGTPLPFICYCGAAYETQVMANLCHAFHIGGEHAQ